jgi:hypothetical protein
METRKVVANRRFGFNRLEIMDNNRIGTSFRTAEILFYNQVVKVWPQFILPFRECHASRLTPGTMKGAF